MSKDCHTADRLLCPVLYACHQVSRQRDYDSLRDMSIRFLIRHIRPNLALASWLDARLIPDGTTCITIKSHRGKHILSQSFSDRYERTLLKFAGCHLRAQSPTSFPMIRRAMGSKDFSDPLTSIARRRGTDFSIDGSFNVFSLTIRRMWDSNPRATFLPPDGFQDRSLQPDLGNPPQINQNQYLALGDGPPRFRCKSFIAPYSGQFLQPQRDGVGLGTSLFTLRYDFEVFR